MQNLKPGGVYYYIIDNYGKGKFSEEKVSRVFSTTGDESILEGMEEIEDQENDVDCHMLFLLNGVNLRSKFSFFLKNIEMSHRVKISLQVLFTCSQIFITGVKKLEKGINLQDFGFLDDLFKLGGISKSYIGEEKYQEYFPKIFLTYFDYHKDLKISSMKYIYFYC